MLTIRIEKKLALALLVIISIVVISLIFYKRSSISKTPPSSERSYADWIKIANEIEPGLCEAKIPSEYLEHQPGIRQYKAKNGKITIIL